DPTTSSASVRFVGEVDPALQNPGGPTQIFRFEADAPGTAIITIPHTVHPDPFQVTIVVP
ncbi:MAG TPA: hypothetical protein VGQ57_22075, partial [Polyangiaceae bacterium]|nr:hypothetical protein [Polyangiaceae bacterium]